jgi:hypothetical protein
VESAVQTSSAIVNCGGVGDVQCTDGKTWDPAQCRCVCDDPTTCTDVTDNCGGVGAVQCIDGKQWDQTLCRCVCVQETQLCTANEHWSDIRCQCVPDRALP